MLQLWRAAERYRGGDVEAGIDTRHAFSFAGFYDPANVRFGPLVACNEERLAVGAGFPRHRHRDIEIVTWVTAGLLAHEDPHGRVTHVRPGDLQRLSAGTDGVVHAERNAGTDPLRFVQMWLLPEAECGDGRGVERDAREPEYELVRGIADSTPYAMPRTDATLHVRRLSAGGRTALPCSARVYVHVVRGLVRVAGETLEAGDAARIAGPLGDGAAYLAVPGDSEAELLVWEMGTEPAYG
ncbi:pirin family protein [Streptomyces oceani]|uniref:Pirin n=1 Tax=Streptomyces oceani TaxID=1075402 RepID=A0A1E7KFB0_9ACTN|nr:pirin family protein [Streptomyces oceani]OEV02608.1 pirin [Streptomyces oceani]